MSISFSAVWNFLEGHWAMFPDVPRSTNPRHQTTIDDVVAGLHAYLQQQYGQPCTRGTHVIRVRLLTEDARQNGMLPIVTVGYDPLFGAQIIARVRYNQLFDTMVPHIYMIGGCS